MWTNSSSSTYSSCIFYFSHLKPHAPCSIWQQQQLWEALQSAKLDQVVWSIWHIASWEIPLFLIHTAYSTFSDVLTTVWFIVSDLNACLWGCCYWDADAVSNCRQITCLRVCGCGICRDSVYWLCLSRQVRYAASTGTLADPDWPSALETAEFISGLQLVACL